MDEIVVKDGWRERLEALTGRRLDAWVVAALVVAVGGVALLLMWWRSAPATIAPPAPAAPVANDSAPAPATPVLVHVAGDVRRPGLYELDHGARVANAIDSAGGPRPGADLDALNLALTVSDGMQVLVPSRRETSATGGSAAPLPGTESPPTPAAININTADQLELETIPGIGPVTAGAILEYREGIGSFASIDELIDVSGIGPATLEAIRPYVTV